MTTRQITFAVGYPLAVAATAALAFVMILYLSISLFGFRGDTPYPCRNAVIFGVLFLVIVAPLSGLPTTWLGFFATGSRRLAAAPVALPTLVITTFAAADALACRGAAPWPRVDGPVFSVSALLGLASALVVWWIGYRRLAANNRKHPP